MTSSWGPWEMWQEFWLYSFETFFVHWYFEYFLIYCTQVNATGSYWCQDSALQWHRIWAMISQISGIPLVQQLVQANNKESIKEQHYWLLQCINGGDALYIGFPCSLELSKWVMPLLHKPLLGEVNKFFRIPLWGYTWELCPFCTHTLAVKVSWCCMIIGVIS